MQNVLYEWEKNELNKLGLDRVYLQKVMVPKWVREVLNMQVLLQPLG